MYQGFFKCTKTIRQRDLQEKSSRHLIHFGLQITLRKNHENRPNRFLKNMSSLRPCFNEIMTTLPLNLSPKYFVPNIRGLTDIKVVRQHMKKAEKPASYFLDKNNFIFQLLSGCLATGLKFEICSVSISSKIETSLKIRYQEKFRSSSS